MDDDILVGTERLLYDRKLKEALNALENYRYSGQMQIGAEAIGDIANDFQFMVNFWRMGAPDAQREELYNQLLCRLYVETKNLMIYQRIHRSSYLSSLYKRTRQSGTNWSMLHIREELENFVSNVALLQLEPEHVRAQKRAAIYQKHQTFMSDLFDYILTSSLWSDALLQAYEELLLAPTVDRADQQLLVSAVTMSLLNAFDIKKFMLLTNVYQKATDEYVRQRALVGWVLCANYDVALLYSEMNEVITGILADERCRREFTELQIQLIYCRSTEEDTRKIRDEIMPDLIENNNFRLTKNGIEEIEDDEQEDILHPDSAEQRMEKMENSINKMMNMQKSGADIYFGGFSQMKRFPFFNTISNWFVPFYQEHPDVQQAWANIGTTKFLNSMMRVGAFCDSDKYSFALAYEQVMRRLPESMRQMMERGEAVPVGGEVSIEDQKSPAFIRRIYLQNLYRFFRLFSARSEFTDPFKSDSQDYLFFTRRVYSIASIAHEFSEVATFLMKRKMYDDTAEVLLNYPKGYEDYYYHMLMGRLLILIPKKIERKTQPMLYHFQQALALKPESEAAKRGLGRAYFNEEAYEQAYGVYAELMSLYDENVSYKLYAATCLANLKRYDEALKLLYLLNYNDADNRYVNRVLAWTLRETGKYEQAAGIYEKLCDQENPSKEDVLNYGYCMWFSGNTQQAIALLKSTFNANDLSWAFSRDKDILAAHNISLVERQLMVDEML